MCLTKKKMSMKGALNLIAEVDSERGGGGGQPRTGFLDSVLNAPLPKSRGSAIGGVADTHQRLSLPHAGKGSGAAAASTSLIDDILSSGPSSRASYVSPSLTDTRRYCLSVKGGHPHTRRAWSVSALGGCLRWQRGEGRCMLRTSAQARADARGRAARGSVRWCMLRFRRQFCLDLRLIGLVRKLLHNRDLNIC